MKQIGERCCASPALREPPAGRPWPLLLLAAALALGACGEIPDSVNPFVKEEKAASETTVDTSKVPGEDADYPNLASVPERPPPKLDQAQRTRIVEGLVADRANARYTQAGDLKGQPPGNVRQVGALTSPDSSRLATVHFAPGSADLSAEAVAVLEQLAVGLRARGLRVRVVGQAEAGDASEEGVAASQRLSAERAQAVAIELMRQGVRRDDIAITAQPTGDDRAEILIDSG